MDPVLVAGAALAAGAACLLIWLNRPRPRRRALLAPSATLSSDEQALLDRINAVAADGEVSDAEREEVAALAAERGLSEDQVREAFAGALTNIMQLRLDQALADGELSSGEDADLSTLSGGLGVVLSMPPETSMAVEDARKLWNIRQGNLPQVEPPVSLQRGEVAHAWVMATASEIRTRTRSVGGHGPTVRIKIMRGVYYSASHRSVSRETVEHEHVLGHGPLVVTNRRLIFAGDRQAITSKLDSILQVEAYSDAIEVTRSSGKPRVFRFDQSDPWFGTILEAARYRA